MCHNKYCAPVDESGICYKRLCSGWVFLLFLCVVMRECWSLEFGVLCELCVTSRRPCYSIDNAYNVKYTVILGTITCDECVRRRMMPCREGEKLVVHVSFFSLDLNTENVL